MTATGFAFLIPALFRDHDALFAQTVASVLSDLWMLFFVPLLLTYLSGGRLRTRADRVLVGAVAVEVVLLAPLWLLFAEEPLTLLLVFPDAQVASAIDKVQRALYLAISVGTAGVVGARWWAAIPGGPQGDAPERRGRGLPVALRGASRRGPRLRWAAAADPPLDHCLLDRPVPLAFLTGLLRSRLARGGLAVLFGELGTMQPAQLQAALARVLHDPAFAIAYPGPAGTFVDTDGRPVELPETGPSGRSPAWNATALRSPRWSMTARSTTTRSSSRPSAGRPRSPWRTGGCRPKPTPGSPSCRRRGSVS